MVCPVDEDGATLYGNFPAKPLSTESADAIVAATGVPHALLAILSLAAINWWAKIKLASPLTGVLRIVNNSAWVYVWLPSVREVTGHTLAWFFQKPWVRGHVFPHGGGAMIARLFTSNSLLEEKKLP